MGIFKKLIKHFFSKNYQNQGKAMQIPEQVNLVSPIIYNINESINKQINPPINNSPWKFQVDRYSGGGYNPQSIEGIAATTHVTIANILNETMGVMPEMLDKQWKETGELLVYPFAGQGLNAFYNRKYLAFFYDKDENDEWFFTSSSHDIVAHELGHAILDILRPDLWNAASLEIWAFHEAFGDIISMLSLMLYPEVVEQVLNLTGGDLRKNNLISDVGEKFGKILFNKNYLRSGINNFRYVDPQVLPKTSSDDQLSKEPHSFSRIFTGAIYDIFVMMYEDLKQHFDEKESIRIARNILARYLGKAVSYAPASVRFFEAMAKTMLWVDFIEDKPWHDRMQKIFIDRKILPEIQALNLQTSNLFGSEPSGMVTVCHSKKEKLCHCNSKMKIQSVDEFSDVQLEILRTDAYIHDLEGNLIDTHHVEEKTALDAAVDLVEFLKTNKQISDDPLTPFEVYKGQLKRSLICCCSGGRTPLKSSPEYYKQYKPENQAGCCGGSTQKTNQTKKKIKRGCYIRYSIK